VTRVGINGVGRIGRNFFRAYCEHRPGYLQERLRGKPAPDTFLAGASAPGVAPAAAVFEDALAGDAGGFVCVVAVDRIGQAEALRERGADLVLADLAELLAR
jgi:beta-phosphoglucomutase-like phosphatase (HAD superfamily)